MTEDREVGHLRGQGCVLLLLGSTAQSPATKPSGQNFPPGGCWKLRGLQGITSKKNPLHSEMGRALA
jgi:hypothetical protein